MNGAPIRRRSFITLLGGAAAAWPVAAGAQQQSNVPVVGYLDQYAAQPTGAAMAAFRSGLAEAGYIEGRNIAIEYRSANSALDRVPEFAAELVRRRVAVIVTPFGTGAALAAKSATTTIPIVFLTSADPVQEGLVASFNRPGGNVTGLSTMQVELGAKRLGLLHELVPKAARFVALVNPTSTIAEALIREVQNSASAIGAEIEIVYAGSNRDIDASFVSFAQKRVDALIVTGDVFFASRRVQFATLATHHRLPAVYSERSFVDVGGLMSYGPDYLAQFRQLGGYVGRILKGEKPADLPVMQPTRFELVINLQTARVLDIEVPATLLATADEVIE